jgi:sugar phosphate permease
MKPIPLIDSVGGVFRSWNLIGNTFATIFLIGIFNVFLAWIPSYLFNGKHLSLATSGILSSTLFAGAVTGNLAGGWLSDNVLGMRRKPLMMLCTLFSSVALIGIIYAPANEVLLGGLLLVTGFFVGLGYPHFTTYPMSLTTREIYPIAFGALNVGAALAGGLFPVITGLILDAYSWDMVFVFLSASALTSLAFLATIQEPSTAD